MAAPLALCAAPAAAKSAQACQAEYRANKAELKAAGTRKPAFIASCRAQADAAAPAEEANRYQQQYLMERRVCPPGSHSHTSAVSANGYECILD
jgi:hypothetical protein